MIVYRLSKEKYSNDLSGAGAELSGGRWNHKGTRILYTSDSRALCTAEIAVHFPVGLIPKDYHLITIEIPDQIKIQELDIRLLSDSWRDFPYSGVTQEIGEEFILKGENLVLKVPSAVVQGDFNYLINPNHKDLKEIKIIGAEPFSFDKRLFKYKHYS